MEPATKLEGGLVRVEWGDLRADIHRSRICFAHLGLMLLGTLRSPAPTVFALGDIIDLPAFARRLERKDDEWTASVWNGFSTELKAKLSTYIRANSGSKVLLESLIPEINNIIRRGPVFAGQGSPHPDVPEFVTKLLSRTSKGEQLARSNRRIMEWLCKPELARGSLPIELEGKWDRLGNNWRKRGDPCEKIAAALIQAAQQAGFAGAVLWDTMRSGSD